MQVWSVTPEAITEIVEQVSRDRYAGNVRLDGAPSHVGKTERSSVAFRIRCISSQGPGHRIRRTPGRGKGFARMPAACWHVHRDVLSELFTRFPDARVRSALADYKGAEDFRLKFPETYWGALAGLGGAEGHPAYQSFSGGLCECDEGSPA